MGLYINKGNEGFRQIRNSEYVDKSGLIAVVNSTLFTRKKMSCVTRSRRFGKSMAAEMLCAAIDQIKERRYPQQVEQYTGEMLLVGISYDADSKQHACSIERWEK